MITRTIMIQTDAGELVPDGRFYWDRESAHWGFDTNDSDIANQMRNIGKIGMVAMRKPMIYDGVTLDAITNVTAKDENFLSALEDYLMRTTTRFVLFRDS